MKQPQCDWCGGTGWLEFTEEQMATNDVGPTECPRCNVEGAIPRRTLSQAKGER